MAETNGKNKLWSIVVSLLLGVGAGSGTTVVVIHERLAAAEVRIEKLEEAKTEVQKVSDKVEEGNKYLRDVIAPAIGRLEINVAVLQEKSHD